MAQATAPTPSAGTGPGEDPPLPVFARRIPFGLMLLVTGITGWLAAGILILEKFRLLQDPDHITSCDINP